MDELAYIDRDFDKDERGYDWMEVIEWAVNATANQPKIRRMAYDQWYFSSRKDLDQFVSTLLLRYPLCTPPSG